ncbi:MAG: phosphatase PAP2 family protein [Acidobacteriota bacterium]
MKLPVIEIKYKWWVAAISYVSFVLLYTLTGNVHLQTPVVLSPSTIDRRIPFIDWTVWIYHSQFLLLALNIALLKSRENLSRVFYALNFASLLSFFIFFIYPTTIPRLPLNDVGLTREALAMLYAIDAPTNCFPSLHISLAWLSAAGVWRENHQFGAAIILWTLFISLSTLTTKQHFFIDVAGGLVIALACHFLIGKIKFV